MITLVLPDRPTDRPTSLVGPSIVFRAGVVTSVMDPDAGDSPFGLAYIKTQAGGVGLKVRVSRQGAITEDHSK